ncbi:MAG: Gldg family protein, partial [Candidatus Tectomicrobia bacterium]|nr:Gldg family protein [Candidatus Tectomicrobia bacterium]
YSEAKTAIEKQNYEVKELLLLREEGIPSDATLLVIAGPQKDLLPGEIDLLRQFIRQDGKVLVMIDPETSPELVTLLTEYGVEVGNNVIVDELSRFFGASKLIPVVSQYQSHPITQNFNLASFFPLARSVEVKPNIAGITAQPLAFTGQSSWAETDLESVKDSPIFQEGVDKRGPLPVAAVVTVDQAKLHEHEESATTEEKKDDASEKGTKARLVVFGDSDFSSNTYFNLSGNQDLFLNTISWLAEEETLIAIRPKDRKTQPILLTPNQAKVIFWLPVIVLPATVIVIGTLVCNQRRK